MNRRRSIKRAAIGSVLVGGIYPFPEAKWCRVRRLFCPPEIILLTLTGRAIA